MVRPEDLRTLEIILTAGCNLTCAYCYQNDKKFRRMSPEVLRGAVDLLMRSRRRTVTLLLIGGEPLLEFDLFREAVEYAKRVRPRGKGIRFVTSTNGTLLDDQKIAFLAKHRVSTQLSFDGVSAAQEVRGKGTFGVLDRLLDRLREKYPDFLQEQITIAVTLLASKTPLLASSVRYFIRKGVTEIAITPVSTHDPDWTTESIDDLDRAFARVFRTCVNHYRRTGEVPLLHFRRKGQDPSRHVGRIQMCGAGAGKTLAVDVDGQVHGCAAFASSFQAPSAFLRARFESMRIGDFRHSSFPRRLARLPEAARTAQLFDDKQDKRSSYGRCGDCRFLGSCSVCPISIGNIPGNVDPSRVPDFLCAWNLVSLKYREHFPRQASAADILMGRAAIPKMMRDLEVFARPRRAETHTRRA